MNITQLAAIDIGSNSIRLLISNVIKSNKEVHFKKISLTRLPVRLGSDSFTKQKISKKTERKIIAGMMAFKYLMEVHEVSIYRACATSAMRDATNGPKIIQDIHQKTGIHVEIISGQEEARLIKNNEFITKLLQREPNILYIDVGGGSTELSLIQKGLLTASASFNIGTVRLLNGLVSDSDWYSIKDWIKQNTSHIKDLAMVGSGGNINRLFKLSGKPQGVPLTLEYLESTFDYLQKFSRQELILKLDLNPDRADVILHACRIYLSVMRWAGAELMYVPKLGLADGIVRELYHTLTHSSPPSRK
ncbi:Ppx/GppA phosphatase family protein [Schleiferia thermophila]|jgi:exopolyphosphatase/guanosine-5'-triphosphate,3'-diphosphate pyrophosphatase|uniref:Exopolyphosphatase/guanosine-5'-triphosphate, 3'-diphosphate pyrophosphatase n=1 Tax=Schleiferia thermophila TaxID=884107 RepID=A0A368ZY11_9FLAO|nr:exopolyphosphatase [Schleiferia thermophila]KFD38814.1 exopolyphosphatase [Schleiferia thermophila str. Yellowstone]RCX01930.1 exopolyphosphatase/guanosine-5'-triphosphate,3'-diphosphate pyrophosphatase [Schleiferia thermophila]GCD79763.1 exopolyphosphatase [Schleiferia thermophila]